jgi:chromosome partitioning protein
MRVISIVNQKGGVGKTTTAINLSAGLASKGSQVLLIDMDSQANATVGLGIDPYEAKKTMLEVLIDDNTDLNEVIVDTKLTNLKLAPANIGLSTCELKLDRSLSPTFILRSKINRLRDKINFDFVIIDCPPSLGLLTLNSLGVSTDIILPIEPGKYALRGTEEIADVVIKFREQLNHDVNLLGVLITRYEPNTTIFKAYYDEIADRYADKVFKTAIPKLVAFREAESAGEPILLYDKKSKASEIYELLTREILERVKEQ